LVVVLVGAVGLPSLVSLVSLGERHRPEQLSSDFALATKVLLSTAHHNADTLPFIAVQSHLSLTKSKSFP
jgi:hypothetical protein